MPGSIELSVNQILHPVLFYPVTLLGIYFCIGLAKILGKNPYTEKFFSLVGKESFHIMALHFLGFKIVDRIYSSVYGITDAEKIGSMCDGAILVIRSGEITRAEVKNSIKQLERSGCKILGVVLNRATDLKNKYSKQKYYSGK